MLLLCVLHGGTSISLMHACLMKVPTLCCSLGKEGPIVT